MIVIDKCFQPQQSPTYGIQPGDTVMAKYWEDGLVSKCRSMSFIEREREILVLQMCYWTFCLCKDVLCVNIVTI